MNEEICGLSSSLKLTSNRLASKEKVECSHAIKETKPFEIEMKKIDYTLELANEIRLSLEKHLKTLSPSE